MKVSVVATRKKQHNVIKCMVKVQVANTKRKIWTYRSDQSVECGEFVFHNHFQQSGVIIHLFP